MYYPVKTSSERWLEKAVELYYERQNIKIIDDASWGVVKLKQLVKTFPRFSMNKKEFFLTLMFFPLAILFSILLFNSLSINHGGLIALAISSLGAIVCLVLPAYRLSKNKPAHIVYREEEVDIEF